MSSHQNRQYLLTQVPEHVVDNPAYLKEGQSHLARYNVAVWLNFLNFGPNPVKLQLKYRDELKEHLVDIDQLTLNQSGQVLLSGVAFLKCRGRIGTMQILASSLDKKLEFRIEEIFVQRHEEKSQSNAKSKNTTLKTISR